MCLKLLFQLNINCYNFVLYKPHSNHKAKTNGRYTKNEEKKYLSMPLQKNYQITKKESKREKTKDLQSSQKTINKIAIVNLYPPSTT